MPAALAARICAKSSFTTPSTAFLSSVCPNVAVANIKVIVIEIINFMYLLCKFLLKVKSTVVGFVRVFRVFRGFLVLFRLRCDVHLQRPNREIQETHEPERST